MSADASRALPASLQSFNGKLRSPGCQTCFIPGQINFDTQNKASHVRADLLSWCTRKADNLTPDLRRRQLAIGTDSRADIADPPLRYGGGWARLVATYLPAFIRRSRLGAPPVTAQKTSSAVSALSSNLNNGAFSKSKCVWDCLTAASSRLPAPGNRRPVWPPFLPSNVWFWKIQQWRKYKSFYIFTRKLLREEKVFGEWAGGWLL